MKIMSTETESTNKKVMLGWYIIAIICAVFMGLVLNLLFNGTVIVLGLAFKYYFIVIGIIIIILYIKHRRNKRKK